MKKVVLDLCGGTGSWSDPWRSAGFTVLLVTLPFYDVRKTTWDDTHFWFISADEKDVVKVLKKDVVGVLAAPPCTHFSRARTTAKTPRDFDGAMEIVHACLGIIWEARKCGSLQWWALENPMGLLRQFLGNPPHSFRGYEYGDRHVKFTDIWGYYVMPTPTHKKPRTFNRKKWASPRKPKQYEHLKLSRADIRAITPAKFAEAFYRANKPK